MSSIPICMINSILKVRSDPCYHTENELKSSLAEALSAKVGTLSLAAQAKLEKDTAKKEAKAEAKADAALKKKLASQVRQSNLLFDKTC